MTTEEKIAVMLAAEEGKPIEYKGAEGAPYNWEECPEPYWNWRFFEYRVKPEPPTPKYRPYANAEECFAEVQKHGGWILDSDGNFHKVLTIKDDKILTAEDVNRVVFWPFGMLADEDEAVWADDGSVCGILVEE